MNRRASGTLWIVGAVLLLLAVAVFLRSKAPPEAARLLPESDGTLFLRFNQIRYLSAIGTRIQINTTSNDAIIDAWRVYENDTSHGRRAR